jgi:hypothetical protein
MFIRTAIALAVFLGAATSALAAPRKQSQEPSPGIYGGNVHDAWQRYYNNRYGNDWSRFRDIGDYN